MIIIQKKEVRTMEKAKDYFLRFLITAIMWIVSRIIPVMVAILFNIGSILSAIIALGLLVLAWFISGSISKWKYPGTIQTNLVILCTIECLGFLPGLLSILSEIGWFDPLAIFGVILYIVLYIWLCYILTGEAKSKYKSIYQSKKP